MTEKASPKSDLPGHGEHLGDPGENVAAVPKLPQNADLHVVHEKCGAVEIDLLVDTLRNFQAIRAFHRAASLNTAVLLLT